MTARVYIALDAQERRALQELAARELRDIRQQVVFIVRCELERQGLIEPRKENYDGCA